MGFIVILALIVESNEYFFVFWSYTTVKVLLLGLITTGSSSFFPNLYVKFSIAFTPKSIISLLVYVNQNVIFTVSPLLLNSVLSISAINSHSLSLPNDVLITVKSFVLFYSLPL